MFWVKRNDSKHKSNCFGFTKKAVLNLSLVSLIPNWTYNVAINRFTDTNSAQAFFACFLSKLITVAKAMLISFNFNQSKNLY